MTPSASRPRGAAELLLFLAAILLSAFLIFLVQPLVGKRILPWYGGAPAVWTLCLAFYQSALFLGYAYAHWSIRFVRPGRQLAVHALAVAAAIALLPVLPGDAWQPRDVSHPSLAILTLLTANVALPFLVLAATGPLVQAWFARRHPQRSPYPLYAVSNLGSLGALLAYPFAIEPRLGLAHTGQLWSIGFAGASCAVLACGLLAWRGSARGEPAASSVAPGRPLVRFRAGLWLMLSACAVVLLMGVTNKLCLDIASVPFLWVVPLATYLVTFVVCFASEKTYRRWPFALLAVLALVPSAGLGVWVSWLESSTRALLQSPPVQIASYCSLLFAACTLLHGELYRLRPPAGALTAFYLSVSAGGALGGIFVGIAAPVLFSDYHELGIGLGLAALLLLALWTHDPASRLHAATPRRRWAIVTGGALLLLCAGAALARRSDRMLHRERSFFGVYRVVEYESGHSVQRRLMNGTTLHGVQILGKWRRLPTSYYGRATGLGLVLGDAAPARRVGVIGLGVGTLAAYGRAGDTLRFYEIDPAVVRIARKDGFFHFLEDSAAHVEVVVGDGRLSLASEQDRGTPQAFDVLILDAFQSDAIPVHLLTVEAFARYVAALAPDGLLAVHASNRHFDVMRLAARVGEASGLHALEIVNRHTRRLQSKASQWVWLARDAERIRALEAHVRRRQQALGLAPDAVKMARPGPAELAHLPLWTDDYSDLFGVLRAGK